MKPAAGQKSIGGVEALAEGMCMCLYVYMDIYIYAFMYLRRKYGWVDKELLTVFSKAWAYAVLCSRAGCIAQYLAEDTMI